MNTNDLRRPLYSSNIHNGMRWAWGAMLALLLAGIVMTAAAALGRALGRHDASVLLEAWVIAPMSAIWLALRHFVFRQAVVWGSAEGLEVGAGSHIRRIPWTKVEQPEWAWFSFNAPGSMSVAYVEIAGDDKRVYFFADDDGIAHLCSLRNAGIAELHGKTTEVSTSVPRKPAAAKAPELSPAERPEFPFIFVPVAIVVILVINIVLALLQSGRAALASILLVGAVFLIVIVFGLRRTSPD